MDTNQVIVRNKLNGKVTTVHKNVLNNPRLRDNLVVLEDYEDEKTVVEADEVYEPANERVEDDPAGSSDHETTETENE